MEKIENFDDPKYTTLNFNFWQLIHPLIRDASLSKFSSAHYADAIRSAFVEIEDRLRKQRERRLGSIREEV